MKMIQLRLAGETGKDKTRTGLLGRNPPKYEPTEPIFFFVGEGSNLVVKPHKDDDTKLILPDVCNVTSGIAPYGPLVFGSPESIAQLIAETLGIKP